MIELAKRISEYVTVLSVLATAAWFVVQPRAEEFINNTVNDQIVILQDQLKQLKIKEDEAEKSQVRSESDLASLKAMQLQTQQMLQILIQRH